MFRAVTHRGRRFQRQRNSHKARWTKPLAAASLRRRVDRCLISCTGFSPSTAPFDSGSPPFDTVDVAYTLSVRDAHTSALPVMPTPAPDASEEQFYADMVVDLAAGRKVRIPSVGPGARVLRARAGIGTQDVRFQLWKDGAENWFIEAKSSTRARVVMETLHPAGRAPAATSATLSWAELLPVPAPPPTVQRSANEVAAKIRRLAAPLPTRRRDEARLLLPRLHRVRGPADAVARHLPRPRALAQGRVPTSRLRVHGDGARARPPDAHDHQRGARVGRAPRRAPLATRRSRRSRYDAPRSALEQLPLDPPPDPFAWPQGATRGDDLAERARHAGNTRAPATPPGAPSSSPTISPLGPRARARRGAPDRTAAI